MAHLAEPFNYHRPNYRVNVTRQAEDDLPAHIKREVEWKTDQYHGPGYYIYSQSQHDYITLEFIEDHWFTLRFDTNVASTAPRGHIEHYARETGYWNRKDPQHYDHQQYLEEQEQERLAARPPTLTVETDVPSLRQASSGTSTCYVS